MLTEGSSAPAWKSLDQDGKPVSSTEYAGRWLLLYFYPKDDTPGCTVEACGFRDHFEELQKNVAILGVSADSVESHQKFSLKYSLPFPLLVDDTKKLITLFGADGKIFPKRITFLIDDRGIVRKIYKNINCENHASEILRDLSTLQRNAV